MAPYVIVGAGLAGGNAAVTLREAGFTGSIVLLGNEPGAPFGRPPLSKGYLRGEESLADWMVRPMAWYQEHDVDFRPAAHVARIDVAANRVLTAVGRDIEYEKVLLATGGRNRRLAVPGGDLDGIHYLRTVQECEAVSAVARPGAEAVVVGMGFIGAEVAASLRHLGVGVTAILRGKLPLARVLGPDVGTVLASAHEEHGVRLINDEVVAFEGSEHVERVLTKGGAALPCDFVVVGVGIEPNDELATGAGIAVNNGILVDERCRTSVPDVYAAGDVANHLHPVFRRLRVEHFNNAERQGRAAAHSMLRATEPYSDIHSFWSDQYEHKIEYLGFARTWDQTVLRGSLERREFVMFYLKNSRVKAVLGFNRGGDPELEPQSELAECRHLIERQTEVEIAALMHDKAPLSR